MRRVQTHRLETPERGAPPLVGQRPPIIRIPPARVRSSAEQGSAQLPRVFPSEAFRPKGAVVRTLFPLCKRCNNSSRLCSLEVGNSLAPKTPRCCSPCKTAHMKFSNAYEDGDNEVLRGFRVLLWEHLGKGSYSPVQPDPQWSDLSQTRTYFFHFPGSLLANGFLPLLPRALDHISRVPLVPP
jgi:hypothetical protein